MDKFIDIKVGDTVYVEREVRINMAGGQSFWVPATVSKVTKQQFEIEGRTTKYWKSDGREVGGGYYKKACYLLGEKAACGDTVSDQSEQMKAFQSLVSKNLKNRDVAERVSRLRLDNANGEAIHAMLTQAEELMKSGQEEKK